jgi:hypothetical protein
MTKTFITAASFALGAPGIALVGYLSANPLAFTHPVAALQFEPEMPSPLVQTIDAKPATTLVLPDVTISALIPRREKAAERRARLEPCSDWAEVGATIITPNGATGVRRVRQLCQGTPLANAQR